MSNSLLTRRERTVMKLARVGMTPKSIASRLQISERTLNRHLQSIYMKLELRPDPDDTPPAVATGLPR
jgi:DNA-binding CsgD family transcriptional regulator